MLCDADEADDVVQEAFVRGYRSLRSCADPGSFGGWMFTILANRCRTAGARRTRRDAVFVSSDVMAGDWAAECGSNGSPGQVMDEDARADGRIEAALLALNAAQREAFLLKYVEEMSYDEMAVVTHTGVSALKMRVSRARELLRAKLSEACDE
ncbi:MAG: RNA polymerase sigma factor [Gemmatimonadota bacterium]|nr:RNA polymerase sigma factor [Gemmatimonadota bacterium]